MNLALCKYWGAEESMSEEDWNELYEQRLFELKRLVYDQIYLPKLIEKRKAECLRIIELIHPEKRFMFLDHYQFKDLMDFEKGISNIKLMIHKSEDFEDLLLGIFHLQSALESYRSLILEYTKQWGDEWKLVEVNSREIFPSGLFLQSMKQGRLTSDWKEALLKERKRITIVF
ncbi:MAG: hypothetical protein RLZZ205_1319 [Bacteroidota bacterium]|jgi:hypothetical protein